MPYLLKGNAQQIFHAFGQDWVVAEQKDDTQIIHRDFPRTNFLGTSPQAIQHFNLWSQPALGKHYMQGNMTASCLAYLLGHSPLQKEGEGPEKYHPNLIRLSFACIDDTSGEHYGITVIYRKDDPKQWVIGLMKGGHEHPEKREVICLSSMDLTPFIQFPDPEVTISEAAFAKNPIFQKLGSDLTSSLLKNAVNEAGEINLRFQRIALLMRKLEVKEGIAALKMPIAFAGINLAALFADNPALDLILQYNLADELLLSTAILKDLLSKASLLQQEIQGLPFTNDKAINKALLKMTLVFFEQKILEKNKDLLCDRNFISNFKGYMWDERQVQLLSFLMQQKHDEDLIKSIKFILSEPMYFAALHSLFRLEPALAIEARKLFNNAAKLEDLRFLYNLPDGECKKLCLIFWVKGSLSLDGYQKLIATTEQYPLLASTLLELDQTKQVIDIEVLWALVLNPQRHIPKSITKHYAQEFQNTRTSISGLNSKELHAANEALLLLKNAGSNSPQQYRLVLANDDKGKVLRLLLPQLKNNDPVVHKLLIDLIYTGITMGLAAQNKKVHAINDLEQLALAHNLHERFIGITLMQDLKLTKEMVELAAQGKNEKARCFRHIIMRVESQCKVIQNRLSGSEPNREIYKKWEKSEVEYRKKLYTIAYSGLMNPAIDVRAQLQAAEEEILNIVDPEIKSYLYQGIIVITNIVLSGITLFIANAFKYKYTGNCWFFNQTRAGEELRLLDKEFIELIAQDSSEPPVLQNMS